MSQAPHHAAIQRLGSLRSRRIVISRDDYGLCPRRQLAFAYIGHAAAGDHTLFARRACRQGFLNPFDLDRVWSRRPEADKSRLPRAANRHSFWFVRGLAAVRGDMDQQELDQLVFVVGAPRDQCAFLPAEIRDPAQLLLIFRAQRQAALFGAGEETITGCALSRRWGALDEALDIGHRLDLREMVLFVAFSDNKRAVAWMSREPITRPGNRVFSGEEVHDQFESTKSMRSAVEVMKLQVRVNTETSPRGAEAVTASVVGNRTTTGSRGDLDHVAVKPDVLGGGKRRLMGIHRRRFLQIGAPPWLVRAPEFC